jgi:small-conductance mechanosensitive channel
VEGGSKAANVSSANFLSRVTHWAVWVFTILVALNQVGIASDIIQILLQGVVVAVSVAVGLAFGLGGQDAASDVIDRIRRGISREN